MGAALCASAQDEGAESKADIKARLLANMEKKENGDVFIKAIPGVKVGDIDASRVDPLLINYLSYVDKTVDPEKLMQSIDRAAKLKKGEQRVLYSNEIFDGVVKYMATKNMNFQKVAVSVNNIAQRIDDGIPLFCWLKAHSEYRGEISQRTKERDACADIKEWSKNLKKSEIKNFAKGPNRVTKVMIVGYNQTTREYLIQGAADSRIWITEGEFKKCIYDDLCALRF